MKKVPIAKDQTPSLGTTTAHLKTEWRWIIYALLSVALSIIPLYGYHLGLLSYHPQELVLWLLLAWAVSIVNALILLTKGLATLHKTVTYSAFYYATSLIIAVIVYFGFHAIGAAIGELWAG